ncbi:hypothetical protein [Robiginitalea sp.]|uniref:hypothetical protein n=1 Tax=Robiginitalea sp. TaxID=1902411 RepID=UPI003C78863F
MHKYFYLILVFQVSVIIGQEGNYKFENFGNQSVLLSGNVTGSVADLGLVFYNPARLGLIENPAFTFGGKAYEWSTYYFDDVLESGNSLNSNQFGGIPATIAGTFDLKFLPKHKFAYSIISRYRTNIQTRYDSGIIEDPELPNFPDAVELYSDVLFRDRLRDDWFGISWAYPITETFSVGASLFGSIYEHSGRGDILINLKRETNEVLAYTNRLDYTQKSYGAQIMVGAAWIMADLEMGVNVTLPFISVKNRGSFAYQESLSGLSPDQDFLLALDYGDLASSRKTATGVAYGVGVPWKNHKLHVNISWRASLGSYDRIEVPEEVLVNLGENPFKEKLRSVVNFGAGGEFYVSPSLNILGSFSSDFSASQESINLFDVINQSSEDINLLNDLWHFALGVDLRRPWGTIVVGTSYASSGSNIGTAPEIPEDGDEIELGNIATRIKYERFRFIIGFEIPIIMDKLKKLPLPIN